MRGPGGEAAEEVGGRGVADGLDGEEDVTAADGVGVAEHFGGLFGGFFDAAPRREVVARVRFGTGIRQLGALYETLDGAEVARFGCLPPPGAVAPAAGGEFGGVGVGVAARAGFVPALDDH